MLKEDIDLVDVVALAIDGEALIVDFSRGDSHLCFPSPWPLGPGIMSAAGRAAGNLQQYAYDQTYTQL